MSLPQVVEVLSPMLDDTAIVLDRSGNYLAGSARFDARALDARSVAEFPGGQAGTDLIAVVRRVLESQANEHVDYHADFNGHRAWFSGAVAPLTEDTVLWLSRTSPR